MAQMLSEDCSQDFQDVEDCVSTSAIDPEYDAWFRRHVEAGLRDLREGRVISSEEMEAEADALCESLLKQAARS